MITVDDVRLNKVKFQPERLKQALGINIVSLNTLCYDLNLNIKYMTEILEGRKTDISLQVVFAIATYLDVRWQFFYTPKPHLIIRNLTACLH